MKTCLAGFQSARSRLFDLPADWKSSRRLVRNRRSAPLFHRRLAVTADFRPPPCSKQYRLAALDVLRPLDGAGILLTAISLGLLATADH